MFGCRGPGDRIAGLLPCVQAAEDHPGVVPGWCGGWWVHVAADRVGTVGGHVVGGGVCSQVLLIGGGLGQDV
jgi:hypothetical protein